MFLVLHYVRSEVIKIRDIIGYVSSIYVTIMVCMNHSQIMSESNKHYGVRICLLFRLLTALHHAAQANNILSMKVLIESGAQLHSVNKDVSQIFRLYSCHDETCLCSQLYVPY